MATCPDCLEDRGGKLNVRLGDACEMEGFDFVCPCGHVVSGYVDAAGRLVKWPDPGIPSRT